jgi:hypothetical protein
MREKNPPNPPWPASPLPERISKGWFWDRGGFPNQPLYGHRQTSTRLAQRQKMASGPKKEAATETQELFRTESEEGQVELVE